MPRMVARIAPLHLRLGLTVCALIAGALAAAQEPPATVGAAGPVYNIEIIVFQDTATLGGAENWSAEAGAGTHSIVAGDESASGSGQVGHFVAMLPASVWLRRDLERRLRGRGGSERVEPGAWWQAARAWGRRRSMSM